MTSSFRCTHSLRPFSRSSNAPFMKLVFQRTRFTFGAHSNLPLSRFQRGEQRVSIMARSILTIFFLCVLTLIILASTAVVHWLDFLYACSYIKLCITLIKYMPQAYMNYRRKSTNGWSIGNVLLDFTGGWLSILQMMINAYNYGKKKCFRRRQRPVIVFFFRIQFHFDLLLFFSFSFGTDDWASIFGDPTKFGLGLFSVMFDILFMVQHYILYRFVFSSKWVYFPITRSSRCAMTP